MKRLIAMIAALTCAGGVWATTSTFQGVSGENFDSLDVGALNTKGTVDNNRWLWNAPTDSEDESLKVTAWGDDASAYTGVRPDNGAATNYLQIETSFTNPVYRAIENLKDDGTFTPYSFDEQIYFDALVNLSAGDASSFNSVTLPSEARLAVWLQEGESDTDAEAKPVLCVKALKIDDAGTHENNTIFECSNDITAGWHRLTVRYFKNVTRSGTGIPALAVYVDGTLVTAKEAPLGTYADARLVKKCADLKAKNALFPSMAQGGQTISAVGFAGNGSVDDLVFTKVTPDFGEGITPIDDQNYFYLTWDENVESISYKVGDATDATEVTMSDGLAAIPIDVTAAATINLTVGYKTGFGPGTWEKDPGCETEASGTTGTFTIPANSLTPSGKIVSASNITVANATIKIDGQADIVIEGKSLSALYDAICDALPSGVSPTSVYIKLAEDSKIDVSLDDKEDAVGVFYLGDSDGVWTLDLNGKTITCTVADGVSGDYPIENVGKSVITDTSSTPGTIKFASGNEGVLVNNQSDSSLSISAGITFEGEVRDDNTTAGISITGGKFLASANQTEGDTPEFSLKSCVDTEKYSITLTDGYYVVASKGSEPVETAVAKIGENEYTTLQDAVDAAVKDATAEAPVTIEIVDNITLTNTLTLTGSGVDATKITINNPEGKTITFAPDGSAAGFKINAATVTFTGDGTWTRTSGSKLIFDVASDVTEADVKDVKVIINGGTFKNESTGHIFNAAYGTIEVNGGSFTVADASKYCVRAETLELTGGTLSTTIAGTVMVKGGTFTGLVGVKNNQTLPKFTIVKPTDDQTVGPKFYCTADNAKKMSVYVDTTGYKLRKVGTNEYYTVAAITYATLTTTFDATMVESVAITNAAGEVVTDTQFDVDDAVVLYANVTLKDGYEIDEANSTLTVTMTASAEIKVVAKAIDWTITYYDDATEPAQFATDTYSVTNRETKTLNAGTRDGYTFKGWKTEATSGLFVPTNYLATATGDLSLYGVWEQTTPAVEPVDPGSETTCSDEASATTEAAAINNAKTTMIKVPEIDSLSSDEAKATFCNLFKATVVTSGEGESTTYAVKVDLDPTADGVKAIQEVIDAIAKPDADGAVKLDLTALATAQQEATITAQPGLYYTVYAGAESPATLTATSSEQATTTTLKLTFPTEGKRGFYKIGVSAKQVTVPQAAQ